MDTQIKARLTWVELYEETKNADYVCRHCGISKPTLRKWYKRYKSFDIEGLNDQSRKPHTSPNTRLNQELLKLIFDLRTEKNLGARRIQTELQGLHNISLGLATIHKALKISGTKPVKRLKRKEKFKRYSRPIPGDRIQVDTCQIIKGIYQYTAVDDCTRWRVL